MPLYVLPNGDVGKVVYDLKRVCDSDPGLTIDLTPQTATAPDGSSSTVLGSGLVTYAPSVSSLGSQVLTSLTRARAYIGIRAEGSEFPVALPGSGGQFPLAQAGGITWYDQYPAPRLIEIVYDPSGCFGRGYFVLDGSGAHIPLESYVALFHELVHAVHLTTSFPSGSIGNAEQDAITVENQYRASHAMPIRVGHDGGCVAPPPKSPPAGGKRTGRSGCLIATAAFGSAESPEVEMLRTMRDDLLTDSRTGREVYEKWASKYYTFSPLVSSLMNRDEDLREMVRWSFVEPVMGFVSFLTAYPDANPDVLPTPWREYLIEMRRRFEEWSEYIPLPVDFDGMSPEETVLEIATLIKYRLWSDSVLRKYLEELNEAGVIPVLVEAPEYSRISDLLHERAVPDAVADRLMSTVLVRPSSTAAEETGGVLAAFGSQHLAQVPADNSAWYYTVNVKNSSQEVFDHVVCFFNFTDKTGVGLWREWIVAPGDVRTFNLGICGSMKSYVLGFFQGDKLVFQFPDAGDMTPQLASQIRPADTERCADSWEIF